MLVAHRLSTVINAHSIVVVDKGRAAEQGNHEALLNVGGTYAMLVRHQVQKQQELSDATSGAAKPRGGGEVSLTELFDTAAKAKSGGEGSSSD